MPTIVVDVMPKAELLDPQGKAVAGALSRRGEHRFSDVRIGKRFELTVDGDVDEATLARYVKRSKAGDDLIYCLVADEQVRPPAPDQPRLTPRPQVTQHGDEFVGGTRLARARGETPRTQARQRGQRDRGDLGHQDSRTRTCALPSTVCPS